MPWITVQLLAGRTVEQKKELVAALTRETSRVCGCSTDAVQIVIEDVQKDNWGIGGVLASEEIPRSAEPVRLRRPPLQNADLTGPALPAGLEAVTVPDTPPHAEQDVHPPGAPGRRRPGATAAGPGGASSRRG
ncbi:MAG: 2-hydroxymuconate tautomerase family protein [Betaproteobacteria bacterium]|nr:2-hydroxymuconate tautomerase family protein [Betaproteobacteria bacterium]